jgi:riboflavin transporter FmnP
MNTKKLTLTIVFAALTIALNPAISRMGVPAPYAPFLIYGLWEISIVAAFLLIGPKSGISVAILNTILLFVFFPGPLPTGPLYNLIAVFSTLAGIYIAQKSFSFSFSSSQAKLEGKQEAKGIAAATTIGIIFRVLVMSAMNYITLRQDYPIGFSMKEFEVLGFLPAGGLFNATLALYTIPIAFLAARTSQKNVRLNLA